MLQIAQHGIGSKILEAWKTRRSLARAPYYPAAEDLLKSRKALERILAENVLPFWYPGVMDFDEGGYKLNHDLKGKWKGPANDHLVTQARTLWFFSRLVNSCYRKNDYLKAAAHGYEYLRTRMWDKDLGGFYWEVETQGGGVAKPDKHLYGQAFGLYALVEYARASSECSAADLACELFDLLERYAHDDRHGGYREFFSRDWRDLSKDRTGYLKTGADIKSMNTHLHLLEAMTVFFSYTANPLAKERLTELIFVLSNTVLRKTMGACTDQHQENWSPLRGDRYDRVYYGHDIENVWLLVQASDAAGVPGGLFLDLYRSLFRYALKYGYDRKQGGFFYSGRFHKHADRLEKIWWVQAEAILGALQMYYLTRERLYWDCFRQTLDWIVSHQADWEHGEWHYEVRRNGKTAGEKAGAWKGPYHNGRAVLECLELLQKL